MIVRVGNSDITGVGVGLIVGVILACGVDVGVAVVEVGVEVGVEEGVGVTFELLTSTMPSVIVVVIGLTTPFCDGLLRIVPSIEI